MKHLDEYRDPVLARVCLEAIERAVTRPWTIMEICGGQTHSIVRHGIDQLLPEGIELVHGPGCPVCVTPIELIDSAIEIASRPETIFCSFGDMVRVPGSRSDLLMVKAAGGDLRIVYSPLDCLRIARENPDREVVFFAVGFETTAPVTAMALAQATHARIENFSLLVSHVLVPPAIEAILSSPENRVEGFLAAGHVCAIMGAAEYRPIAARYGRPIVITGFEPVDLLQGILACVRQLEAGRCDVENRYARSVREDGNESARNLIGEHFTIVTRRWRGIGEIPASGLAIAPKYRHFDAVTRFGLAETVPAEPTECIAGLIMQGVRRPNQCPAFGTTCSPERPLGAPMVSSEGACAAYHRYRRN